MRGKGQEGREGAGGDRREGGSVVIGCIGINKQNMTAR